MSKRSSKRKRRSKTLPALGFAGVSLSMASGACASSEASANTPPPTSQSQNHEMFLGEEEISDVSLATFYVFDKENTGQPPLDQHLRLARGGCGGGGGCGCGGGGGGGCHMGCGGGGCGCAHPGGGGACAAGIGCGHPGGAWGGGRPGGMACTAGIRPGIGVVHPGGAWGCRPGIGGRCRCGGRFFFRGCGCGGCGGCGGCWGSCWIWDPIWGWVNTCWSESKPPAEVSSVASEQSLQTAEIAGKGDGSIVTKRTK
jgi:hypothetical protein